MALIHEVTAAYPAPIGSMKPYGGSAAPTGWLLCDGTAVLRSTYANLFAAISTSYGVGDGSTTFNVPDLRGRVAVGKNAGTFPTLGATGGEETHVITEPEMPIHAHTGSTMTSVSAGTPAGSIGANTTGHTHGITQSSVVLNFAAGASVLSVMTNTGSYSTQGQSSNHAHVFTGSALGGHAHTLTINSDGGNGGHNNIQPYQVVNHIIKY